MDGKGIANSSHEREAPAPRLHPISPADIDEDARKVIHRLTRYGYQAYLCGGGVRDILAGRRPKDFDIATSAHPSEVRKLFRNCRIIGRRFRLAHVYFRGGKVLEVATFRSQQEYVADDGHAGGNGDGEAAEAGDLLITDDNTFGTAETDARRRDFTINGLFYDVEADRVIDHVNGLPDLERGTIRTIGDPAIRFQEDPVRILRAIKLAARLGFRIERDTFKQMLKLRGEIARAAQPRILLEVMRMLGGGAALDTFRLLYSSRVLDVVLPGVGAFLRLAAGTEDETLFWRHLETVDMMRREGLEPSENVLLAVVFLPIINERAAQLGVDPEAPEIADVISAVLATFAARSAITKRMKARIREILVAQRRLRDPSRRPAQLRKMMGRDYFPEALSFFQLDCRARGVESATEPGGASGEGLDGWRKNRRRGRRRGGGRKRPDGASSGEIILTVPAPPLPVE